MGWIAIHTGIPHRRNEDLHHGQFVTYITSKPGVWFATAADIARHVKAGG